MEPQMHDEPEELGEEVEAPPIAPTHLAGAPLKLETPRDLAERWDLHLASLRVPTIAATRVWAAAIALCWPEFRRKLAKQNVAYAGDVVAYGGRVLTILRTGAAPLRGRVSFPDLSAAGKAALALASADLLSEDDIKAKVDFSEAPGEGSPGSSS